MTSESARRLRATIAQLEEELNRIDALDPETRDMLAEAVSDLQETLRKKREGEETDDQSLLESLEAIERRFQVQHPTLAGLVLRTVEALRQWGI